MNAVARFSFEHRGFQLSYLDTAPGDSNRPVVLLMHGFPDTAEMWQAQMRALHDAGYRCIAADTLGCGESDMAPRVGDYNAIKIATDYDALLGHLGISQAHVAGHDWGAVIAWVFAAYFPARTKSLVVMSVGHPTAYARSGWAQKKLGWYTFFFQLGGVSEVLLSGEGRFSLRNVFRTHPHMDEVMQRLRAPGRMQAAVRIYRAAVKPLLLQKQPPVSAPTLGLWSVGDRFLTESQMLASEHYVENDWRYERLEGHHWMTLEQPEKVNALLLAHFERYS